MAFYLCQISRCRQFEASQRVLEQFFCIAESLGLQDLVRLEDTAAGSRTSLMEMPCSPAGSRQRSPSPRASTPTAHLASISASSLSEANGNFHCSEDTSTSTVTAVPSSSSSVAAPLGPCQTGASSCPQSAQTEKPADDLQSSGSSRTRRICPHCTDKIPKNNYARHLQTHSDRDSKKCNLCGKVVKRGDHMKRHKESRCRRYRA